MLEKMTQLKCGNCGEGEAFGIYTDKKIIAIECKKCKSVSIITITKPTLIIEWGENSDGILAPF